MALNKSKIHHYLRVARSLRTWQLIAIVLLMSFVSATFLRLNNIGMIERRTAVVEADKSGNKEQTIEALRQLRNYVNSHMNTNLNGGVYLEQSYNRDRTIALQQANNASNPNSAAYQQASTECRSRFAGGTDSFRNDYVQCVIDRVGALTQASDPTAGINLPKADAYRHNFISPIISFDLAGISVLFTLLMILVIVLRLLLIVVAKLLLKKHFHALNS